MPRESKPFTRSFHVPCSAGVAHSHLYVRYGRSPLHQIRQAGRGRAPHPREVLNNYTMDSFQYEPLQPNGNQVRLLCFSDDPGGQPGYTLKTFDINECPPYDALSYMWGPPLPTRIISLNKDFSRSEKTCGTSLTVLSELTSLSSTKMTVIYCIQRICGLIRFVSTNPQWERNHIRLSA